MSNDISSPNFWNNCYIKNDIGWDLGSITPVFKDWCDKLNGEKSILVPGAGNGYDPLYFAKMGHNVTAVDFSDEAVANMKIKAKKNNIDIQIINQDIFKIPPELFFKFDYVIEYTCFCAIDPLRRLDYIKMMHNVLRDKGSLVGLFLPLLKNKIEGGPPFAINLDEVINQFSGYFNVVKSFKHPLSIEPRNNNEQFIHFQKK